MFKYCWNNNADVLKVFVSVQAGIVEVFYRYDEFTKRLVTFANQ